jgi:hypothetical protein
MATAVDFRQLTESVNEAQVKIKAAASQTRDTLRAQVEQAQHDAEEQAVLLQAETAQAKGQASPDWQSMKLKWQAHLQDLHRKAEDKKAQADQRKAEIRAEKAELDADDAVSFAIAAVQEAEYAVLDAVLARSDAETMA